MNLRDLSGFYPSVSEICRRIDINRQQFNKYLLGTMMPSLYNLRRISDFFGVDEAELTLPHEEFRRIVFSRQLQERLPTELAVLLRKQNNVLKTSSLELDTYLGWYSCYLRSPTYNNKIVRDVTYIFKSGDYIFSKSINISNSRPLRRTVFRNHGLVFWQDERIYLVEAMGRYKNNFTLCVLYPSSRRPVSSIQGMLLGVGKDAGKKIYASRLIMDYLGPKINLRQAIRASGTFELSDDTIDAEIRKELQDGMLFSG